MKAEPALDSVKVTLKHNEEAPISTEIIADCVVAIAEGVKKLRAGRLNERALILLIQHASPNVRQGRYSTSPISSKTVRAVLAGMESLEREYLKPKKDEAKKKS